MVRTLFVSLLFTILAGPSALFAQIPQPQSISFQGYLSDSGGVPVTDTLLIQAALYDSLTSLVWVEAHYDVPIIGGVFNIQLGSQEPFASAGIRWNQPYELGITIGEDEEMTPRTPFTSVPFVLSSSCEQYSLTTCPGGCAALLIDPENCGSCGNNCKENASCDSGVCVCDGDLAECSEGCFDLASDPNHCGDCGVVCGGADSDCCSGTCTNLFDDELNCGECGAACPSGQTCIAGGCLQLP